MRRLNVYALKFVVFDYTQFVKVLHVSSQAGVFVSKKVHVLETRMVEK